MILAVRSVIPPVGNGTISFTSFEGKFCATAAGVPSETRAIEARVAAHPLFRRPPIVFQKPVISSSH